MAVDVFLIGGQSNSLINPPDADAPSTPAGRVLQFVGGTTSDISGLGGAWTQFGAVWASITDRTLVFVPTAIGGTAQAVGADAGNGNWDITGALFGASLLALQSAISSLSESDTILFRGILWGQGERDAQAINAGDITQAVYQTALQGMVGRFSAQFGSGIPFLIFRTGSGAPTLSDSGFAAVRGSQDAIEASCPNVFVCFRDSVNFASKGYMRSDNLHYNQDGYNEMGDWGAKAILDNYCLVG